MCFAADGASKDPRALFLAAQEVFKNAVLVVRDPAHALRISVKNPLRCDELFGEVWGELFNKRHALAPDIMNSTKWQSFLQQIQKHVIRIPCRHRPLAIVLKHLQFAKQRFNSAAGPVAKVAFVLLPIATLVAFTSSDQRRNSDERARAKALLRKLQSKFCLALGLSADWGIVCEAFLRLFDKKGHDIARSASEISNFKFVLKTLFIDGYVFYNREASSITSKTQAIGGYLGKQGARPKFVTRCVEKQLRQRCVSQCGEEICLLWGQRKPD